MKNADYRCRWLLVFSLLVIASTSLRGDEGIEITRNQLNLSDRNVTGQAVMNLELEDASGFYVTVNVLSGIERGDQRFVYLHPQNKSGHSPVKVHIDFPYKQLTPGGAWRVNTLNTVEPGKKRMATRQYSQCPGQDRRNNTERVCKPFSFVVIDEGAEPGTLYQAKLNVRVDTAGGKSLDQTITLTYKSTRSAIGIYSPSDRFLLNQANHFTEEKSFCVYSPGKAARFDVQLEGQGGQPGFLLRNKGGETIEYQASIRGRGRGYQPIEPKTWTPVGLSRKQTKKLSTCDAYRNLWVQLNIPESEVMAVSGGHYSGILMVRVRAQ